MNKLDVIVENERLVSTILNRSPYKYSLWLKKATGVNSFSFFLKNNSEIRDFIYSLIKKNLNLYFYFGGFRILISNSFPANKCVVFLLLFGCRWLDRIVAFKAYSNGDVVEFSEDLGIDIYIWHEVSEDYFVYKNTKFNNAGVLSIQNKVNINRVVFKFLAVNDVIVPVITDVFNIREALDTNNVKNFDIVYTWVDGDDPVWASNKLKYTSGLNDINHSANCNSRFISRDELKYSICSVLKYLPEVRKIFIVTDSQIPSFFDGLNSKIEIVDHRDIFPDESILPVFNSHSIESVLHNIEGLQEHYLYFNDDVFLGKSMGIGSFYDNKFKIKVFPSKHTFIAFGTASKNDLPVDSAAKNARALLKGEGFMAFNKFKHTPIPQLKSKMFELERLFIKEIVLMRKNKFRAPNDLSITSSLFYNYMLKNDLAEEGEINYKYIQLGKSGYFNGVKSCFSRYVSDRPDVFCINDVVLDESIKNRVSDEFAELASKAHKADLLFNNK